MLHVSCLFSTGLADQALYMYIISMQPNSHGWCAGATVYSRLVHIKHHTAQRWLHATGKTHTVLAVSFLQLARAATYQCIVIACAGPSSTVKLARQASSGQHC